jgi:hypothetical protein
MPGLLLGKRARAAAFFAIFAVSGGCNAAFVSAGLAFLLRFDAATRLLGWRSVSGESSAGEKGTDNQGEERILEFHGYSYFWGFEGRVCCAVLFANASTTLAQGVAESL